MRPNVIARTALFAGAAGFQIEPAWAYIDPNSGGMLFQLLVPVFAAIVAFFAYARSRVVDTYRSIMDRLMGRGGK